jgi:hypothetical protein
MSLEIMKALAQITPDQLREGGLPTGTLSTFTFRTGLQIVFGLAGGAALIILAYACLRYVLSRGDPEATTKARNTIIDALIGLAVIVTAFGIITLVMSTLFPAPGGGGGGGGHRVQLLEPFSVQKVYAGAGTDVFNEACEGAPGGETPTLCTDNRPQEVAGNSLYGQSGVLTRAAQLMAIVVGVASVIMIVIGGFKYVMASGDPSKIASARDTILYALLGSALAATTQGIVVFVLNNLG